MKLCVTVFYLYFMVGAKIVDNFRKLIIVFRGRSNKQTACN